MVTLKFGGSSLSSLKGFECVAARVRRECNAIVVASAIGKSDIFKVKLTDMLIAAYSERLTTGTCGAAFDSCAERICSMGADIGIDMRSRVDNLRGELRAGYGYDYIVSRGEWLTAYMLSIYLDCPMIDASKAVKFTMDGRIDYESTTAHAGANVVGRCVVPGFYGSMPDGSVKCLTRGGSDTSGALIAAATGCELYRNYTDVDGLFSAPPDIASGRLVSHMSAGGMQALSRHGVGLVHEDTVAAMGNVTMTIGNTYSGVIGTTISRSTSTRDFSMGYCQGLIKLEKNLGETYGRLASHGISIVAATDDFVIADVRMLSDKAIERIFAPIGKYESIGGLCIACEDSLVPAATRITAAMGATAFLNTGVIRAYGNFDAGDAEKIHDSLMFLQRQSSY